jgi:uncharacterized protein (TIGR02145 family)
VAGGKLKESGFTNWLSPNEGASNETGFTALPGGSKYFGDGSFEYLKSTGYWWTSSSFMNYKTSAWRVRMFYQNAEAKIGAFSNPTGMSVRCIKDN